MKEQRRAVTRRAEPVESRPVGTSLRQAESGQRGALRVAMLSVHSCPLGRPGTRDTGGMSIYVQNVARDLGQLGIAVDVFTRRHQPGSADVVGLGERARLIHLPLGGNPSKTDMFPYLPEFAEAVDRFRDAEGIGYDIVHSHYWLSGWVGMALAEQWQVPHVTMLHTSARGKERRLGYTAEPGLRAVTEQQVLSLADLVVASTDAEKQDLAELYGVEPSKTAVIPCGVDLETFRPLPKAWARRAVGLNGLPVVLYVGRLGGEKGVHQLLEATAIVSEQRPVHLMIVGGDDSEPEELTELYGLSHSLGIESMVRFHRAIDQDELPLYYSSADVMVLPSRYETFGLVALEAMACGLPVVAAPVGVMPTLVQDGGAGLLTDDLSPRGLADTLGRFLEDEGLQQRLSRSARSRVAGLSWASVAERLAGEYGRLATVVSHAAVRAARERKEHDR
ncbi:MAG: glycosyltransferase [Chloroflexi bacterium]|nr:glycosyltransferase [Chloroflexota bacterium]